MKVSTNVTKFEPIKERSCDTSIPPQKERWEFLLPELWAKISGFTQGSRLNLRLAHRNIDKILREDARSASLDKSTDEIWSFELFDPKRFPNLKAMKIQANCANKDANFIGELAQLSLLQVLELTHCSKISSFAWHTLFDKLENLSRLKLSEAQLADRESTNQNQLLDEESKKLGRLVSMDFYRCSPLADSFLEELLSNTQNLSELTIRQCSGLSGWAFHKVELKNLQLLKLSIKKAHYHPVEEHLASPFSRFLEFDLDSLARLILSSPNLEEFHLNYVASPTYTISGGFKSQLYFAGSNLKRLILKNLNFGHFDWITHSSPKLESLKCKKCNLSGIARRNNPKYLNNLQQLDLIDSNFITEFNDDPGRLRYLLSSSRKLENLKIENSSFSVSQNFDGVQLRQLRRFQFRAFEEPAFQGYRFRKTDLANLARNAPLLEELSIVGYLPNEIQLGELEEELLLNFFPEDNESFEDLNGALGNLKSAVIAKYIWSSSEIFNLLKASIDLTQLRFVSLPNIGDDLILNLIEHLPNLKKFEISNCGRVSPQMIREVIAYSERKFAN